ncbi:rod shape-determining protein MreD [Salipaludibacillus sp. CUR1]|uniref:rod shape-determining protein MreD n=1 Tax=Salipaludibacillus sp. CUR1 TaxID=2820003 RepID=UPI001E5D2178|nr:rod shape-determining protein MreD [Salipaludibacillus sp. CUR1]MCE7793506.1 rod shape-determining protein MreD [Salipaludibacillus sp. CUR1]
MIARYSLIIVVFILFIVEGTVYQIFAPDLHGFPYQLIPRWMFMLILLTGIFRGRGYGLFYGIVFGVFYDIVYSQILGIYTFGMGLIAYILSISIPFIKDNVAMTILTVTFGVVLLEYYVFGMMTLLGVTDMPHETFFNDRFLPTMIMNFTLLVIFTYPLRLWFQYLEKKFNELV